MAVKDRSNTPWLTREEAAAYARCSVKIISALVSTGALPACKPLGVRGDSNHVVINKEDIDEVIRGRVIKVPLAAAICGGLVSPDVVLDVDEVGA